jgi:serine/threonine-protein kinase
VSAGSPETSRSFGKYELTSLIARGGMGEVWLGCLRGELGFEKKLVLKTIRPELARDPKFVAMFAAEAKTAVALSHGNIVPIYELGRSDEVLYIAMGHVDGPSLSELLARHRARGHPVDAATALFIVREVLTGLAYAHTGERDRPPVVHRDISPRNILVDRSGQVRIVDFGIALSADQQVRMGGGSTGYMAPEQARAAAADPRADVFAAACVLYELLTLRRAFPREGVWIAPDLEGVPAIVAPVLAGALDLDPEQRPADARAMLRELGPAVAELCATYTTQDLADHLRAYFPHGWSAELSPAPGSATPATPATGHTETFATRLTAVAPGEAASPASDAVAVAPARPAAAAGHTGGRARGRWLVAALAAAAAALWLALGRPPASTPDGPSGRSVAPPIAETSTSAPTPPPAKGPFVLRVEPTDARVEVTFGGQRVAGPPFEIAVPDVTRDGKIAAAGYRTRSFELGPGDESRSTTITLEPVRNGTLSVVAPQVNYAWVWIDNRKLDHPTPITHLPLPEGKHKIRVVCPADVCGSERVLDRGTVTVEAGRDVRFEVH